MRQIDVPADALDTLRTILRRHIPDREIRAIGSRVSGRAKSFSDLDVVIMGDDPLPLRLRGALRDDLDESNLPFVVDIVEWATASPAFRYLIERDGLRLSTEAGAAVHST